MPAIDEILLAEAERLLAICATAATPRVIANAQRGLLQPRRGDAEVL